MRTKVAFFEELCKQFDIEEAHDTVRIEEWWYSEEGGDNE